MSIKEELIREIEALSEDQLRQLLDYTRQLKPRGKPLAEVQHLVGLFPEEDIREIEQAIMKLDSSA